MMLLDNGVFLFFNLELSILKVYFLVRYICNLFYDERKINCKLC